MAAQKRIAFLCHPYHRGGVTRWMADAAMAAAAAGHEVYFITVSPAKEFFSAKGRETLLQLLGSNTNVRIITTGAGYEFEFGTPEYKAHVYRTLLVQLPAGTPVILSDDAAVWAAGTALNSAYPAIGVLHADEGHYYSLAATYYHSVAMLACVSGRVSKTVRERVPGLGSLPVYTIPCGINLPPVVAAPHSAILQLVYVGRISDYQKRTGDLVKICAGLSAGKIPFHLHIIGDGAARTSLEHKAKESGLQDHITFCGWLPQQEVVRHLAQSDVLLLTSDFEGTPIAMMEAFAAGCGMVGTRVSGIEDYEHHPLAADCLAVYTVGDIPDAVNKINTVAAMPVNQRKQAARKLAETEFSMQVCLGKYFEAINKIPVPVGTAPSISLSPFALLYSKVVAIARYLKVRGK